jgi:hypothetical protein
MKIGFFERVRCPQKDGVSIGKIEIRLPRLEEEYSYINDFYYMMGERVLKKAVLYLAKMGGRDVKLGFSVSDESTEKLLKIERKITVKQNGCESTYLFTDCFDLEKRILKS